MSFDPKIFIRDYGNPTYQTLALSGQYNLKGYDTSFERHLILKAENQTLGETNIGLEGDATDGDDILLLEGDEDGNALIIDNPALFQFIGYDVDFLINLREIETQSGVFTLTGHDVDFLRHHMLKPEPGAFTLTGHDVDFLRHINMDVDPGGFTFTGYDVEMTLGYEFRVDPGAFALTGYDVTFEHHWMLEAQHTTFTFTFWPVDFVRNLVMPADAGAFVFTGYDVDFYGLSAGEDSILLEGDAQTAGYDSLLLEGDEETGYVLADVPDDLITESGAFTLTGHHASFEVARIERLLLDGDEQITGEDAIELEGDESGVLLQEFNTYTIDADAGAFALAGHDANFTLSVLLATEGDEQDTGDDVIELEGDEAGNLLLTEDA